MNAPGFEETQLLPVAWGQRERLLIGTSPLGCLHSQYLVVWKVRLLSHKSIGDQQLNGSVRGLNLFFFHKGTNFNAAEKQTNLSVE